jgi:ParB/RepB/Spo0J family partition protein
VATQTHSQQLTVPLSSIVVDEGFNPRSDVERSQLDRLAKSIEQHGLIQPLVVTPQGEGYRLIDGERRYRACGEAKLVEVPVIVREADEQTEALDVALVANSERVVLTPVDEAKAFKRLLDAGLTRKGIAERCGVSQKLVSERLALLTLDEELYPKVADGTIPPGAIRPLVELAKIHPRLPARAVAEIAAGDSGDYTQEPYTWADVVRDPLEVVIADEHQLPADVYTTNVAYPLERFALTDKAQRDLAKWAQLEGRDPAELSVRFGSEDVAAAEKLGAAHRGNSGWSAVIVGQEVADQLVCDQVKALLKRAREWAKRTANAGARTGSDDGGAAPEPVEDETLKEERRREREQQQQQRREAAAHNAELGAACVKHLARVKVDDRVVRILSAFDLGDELDKIAMRGARYGLPGWVGQQERKSGETKPVYLDRGGAEAKAREFVTSAKSAGDLAGRQIVLLAMARYADEDAVAQSGRSFYTLTPGRQLPFSDEVIEDLDELARGKLPAHVLDRGREERERQAAERAQDRENDTWYEEQLAGIESMSPDGRQALLAEVDERFGSYDPRHWQLRQRIERLDAAEPSPDAEEGDAAA